MSGLLEGSSDRALPPGTWSIRRDKSFSVEMECRKQGGIVMSTKSRGTGTTSPGWLVNAAMILVILFCAADLNFAQETAETRFRAIGLKEPERQDPAEFGERGKPSVEVFFDLVPTTMRFHLPSFPCMVTENNIRYSNFWAETYEPRIGGGSFETLMDRDYRYARMWIQSQNDARIIVRVRGALCNRQGDIAHSDIASGSPYGDGDWVDEWFYIYPDGVHVRHVKIYTGLASRSRPFGFDRDPPKVVHEFMESAVLGEPGHLPTDDIKIDALTLIRLIGGHTENRLTEGESATISYKPYPEDFGDFRDANILLVNLKAEYKPFTIGMPYGVRVQPYWPEDDLPHVFQTWGNPPDRGYASAFGHFVNYWHYRRTDNTLEQIYLQGMTNAEEPVRELVFLAWSWIAPPRLWMEGVEMSYTVTTYDPAQRAYIISVKGEGQTGLEFTLEEDEDIGEFGAPMRIVNPAFIIKGWERSDVEIMVDGKTMQRGKDFRAGYEDTEHGTNLIIWLKLRSSKPIRVTLR
jgi:hypothetical protein